MIIDIFATIDNAPIILKRPLLPYTHNTFRIPLFVKYYPQATNWPEYSWYFLEDMERNEINAILIAGRRYEPTTSVIPSMGYYSKHLEDDAIYICIGMDLSNLLIYEKEIEIITTIKSKYSLYGNKDVDNIPNPPMILSIPELKKRADALKYSKLSFETIKMNFIRDQQSINLFGGEAVIKARIKDNDNNINDCLIGKYITDRIEYDMNEVEMSFIDYRYLLNRKYPTDVFTRTADTYPYLEESYEEKVKPVCFGIGNGIPGICTNGLQIYDGYPNKIKYYDFQFPPGWTNIYKVEVLNGDRWSEVYPGLGNPFLTYSGDLGHYIPSINHPNPIEQNSSTGVIKIHWSQVVEGANISNDTGWGNGIKKVRMFGLWPNSSMKNAIKTLLELADKNGELVQGFDGEFHSSLGAMGLYMDSSESIFTWIEKIQAGNILGGQLILKENKNLKKDCLFFKLENPNRLSKFEIPKNDVINHEKLSIESAEEFWYSGWDILFKKSHTDETGTSDGHLIGEQTDGRYPTAAIYNAQDLTVSFSYETGQKQSFNLKYVRQRERIIRDLIKRQRHKIKGLILPMYSKYLNLSFFDVIEYLPKVLEENKENSKMEWIIYDISKNIKQETITLTIIERIKSLNWNDGYE